MPSTGFELTIPSIESPKPYALHRTASGRIEPDPRSVQSIANRYTNYAVSAKLMFYEH